MQLGTNGGPADLVNSGATSELVVNGDRLPLRTDLSLLPLPFFDAAMQTTTTITFVFPASPTSDTLKAAGIVASWLGVLTSSKPIHYLVAIGEVPTGNLVIFRNAPSRLPSSLHVGVVGPSLSIRPNPADPSGSALILSGEDDSQLVSSFCFARSFRSRAVSATTPLEDR